MAALAARSAFGAAVDPDIEQLHFSSPFLEAQLSATLPEFVSLDIDGLGKGRRGPNMIAGRTNVDRALGSLLSRPPKAEAL